MTDYTPINPINPFFAQNTSKEVNDLFDTKCNSICKIYTCMHINIKNTYLILLNKLYEVNRRLLKSKIVGTFY